MKKWEKIFIGAIGTIAAAYIGIDSWNRNNNHLVVSELYGPPSGYYIRSFNAQFTSYEGSNLKAAHIRALFATINAIHAAHGVDSEEDEYFVKYTGPSIAKLRNDKRYKVELKYNDEGYVCEVIVTENGEL